MSTASSGDYVPVRAALIDITPRMHSLYRLLRRGLGMPRQQANHMVFGAVLATGEGTPAIGHADATMTELLEHIGGSSE